MGMQPPRSSLGSDFSPSKFGPNNMPSMKHAGTPMPPRHWNRDSSGRHYGLQRTPLLQHAAAGARPSFPVGSLNSSPALINDGQKQARQMEHWQLSGKRDRSNTGPSSDWQQTKPNLGQRLPVERQWRGNAPNAGQPQWPSGRQPLSDQSANWSRQSSSRNNTGEMWSPSSNLPGARSNYQSQQTADNSKSDEHVRKSVDGDDIQQTQERWNSSERKMPPGGDHWESSDKPGYNEQSKWSRNSNDWQSPQQPKTPRMQWSSTGKSAGDRWGPSDPSHHQNVDNSWSEHSFSENDQKWNSPSRVSANESSEQWNSRRPARSSAAGDSLRQQEWGNSGTESNMDSSNLRGAWQSQRPQYPPASLHSNPQDPSWHNGLKPPTDDQGWSRAPINPSATGPYAAQASRPVDPNFGSLRQPYRMYPPQANPLARMIGTSMSSTNQAPNQYRQQSAWPQQSPNKALRPPLSLPSMSQAPPQSQNYPPARVPSAVPMQQQMRPSYPDTHNAYNNRLLSNPPQSLMMQSANPAVSVANQAGSTGGSTASISAASQQPLGSWSALSSAAASPSIAGYYSQQQLPVQPYQAVQNQAMTPQQRPSQQYQQQLGNMQTAQLQQQSTTTPLQQQYSAAFQQQQYNSQQSSAAAGAAAVAAAWSMAQSSTASTKPVASAAPTNMQASATQYGSSATLRPINAASMTAKQQLAGATSGTFSPVGTATPASYNYSSIYAAQQAAVYNQAATAATSVAAQQQPATSYQQMQQQQPYQLAAASAHHYPGGSATTGNASSYPYSAITGNSSAGTLSSLSANHSSSSAASLQQQASAGSASNLSSTTASAQLPATTSSGATTTSSTTVGAQQMIDEPTAYAGYLSAGYDQATAKAMATAYVQQQQQYYQWHQQWAAAAAVASSAQAAASANPAVSGSVATSAATIGSSGGQQQAQQLSGSSQK
ncbi:hypothetical protein GJ496_010726 [Pomphorhynchus laevis]|nr:hypothetical protein GJ496_010726 [Pomphorhynchus laevis]